MHNRWKHKAALAGFFLGCFVASTVVEAETIKPIKDSGSDIAGAIFKRQDAVNEYADGNATTDVVTFNSKDSRFQTGMFKSGPAHEEIKGPDGFPYNEFLYFISGGAKLTSADGSVVVVGAGEAVTIPEGWTGTFDTEGYTKMYVTYHTGKQEK